MAKPPTLTKNAKGQSIVEFVLLVAVLFGFSFLFTYLVGDKFIIPYWKAIVGLIIEDPSVTLEFY
ncbi:MAG: hypothetical protein JNM93_09615 [Bacteriovoracaceae bacterium]|nr:hypothetical protein [Bacteriovoracaceae bacterium]